MNCCVMIKFILFTHHSLTHSPDSCVASILTPHSLRFTHKYPSPLPPHAITHSITSTLTFLRSLSLIYTLLTHFLSLPPFLLPTSLQTFSPHSFTLLPLPHTPSHSPSQAANPQLVLDCGRPWRTYTVLCLWCPAATVATHRNLRTP